MRFPGRVSVSPARSSRAPKVRTVAIALGSNVGERETHLEHAVRRLGGIVRALRVSSFHETLPEGITDQPLFLNAAAVGESTDPPEALLGRLQEIEMERGRERPSSSPGGPRTLDLDLILVGDEVVQTGTLTVPHPRFRERAFVLEPLAEVAPDLVDPESGLTVQELLERLDR